MSRKKIGYTEEASRCMLPCFSLTTTTCCHIKPCFIETKMVFDLRNNSTKE